MKELKHIVADMESVFAQSSYPQDFLAAYDQMECLASHKGRETFLVQRKSDGEMAIASCYDRAAFPLRPDIQLLQDLNHPGLPHYYEEYRNEQMLCVLREYIEGEPLSAYARDRQLSIEDIASMARRLCDILQVLHTHEPPVVHRDIKPENIIVKPDGDIVLIDFDIARAVKAESGTDTVFFGTKGYAPPEQYGFGQTDGRTDIYAFGVLLRWLVTGSDRENGNISTDPDLQHIIDRCTAFAPQQRFSDVGEVRRALESVGRRKRRFDPRAAVALALAAILMLCAGFAVGRWTDWLRPVERISFQEPLIEKAARLWIGKEQGALTEEDLARVTHLYIFGDQAFGEADPYNQCDVGSCVGGPIRTLDDLQLLKNLQEVHIAHQGYVDATGIAGMPKLYTVDLRHMYLSGIAAIADSPGLKHAFLPCNGLSDVTALQKCRWLETLDIGLNDIPSLNQVGSYPNVTSLGFTWLNMDNVDDIAQRFPKAKVVTLQHTSIRDLSGLKALPNLEAVWVLNEQADAVRALFEGTDVQVNVTEN